MFSSSGWRPRRTTRFRYHHPESSSYEMKARAKPNKTTPTRSDKQSLLDWTFHLTGHWSMEADCVALCAFAPVTQLPLAANEARGFWSVANLVIHISPWAFRLIWQEIDIRETGIQTSGSRKAGAALHIPPVGPRHTVLVGTGKCPRILHRSRRRAAPFFPRLVSVREGRQLTLGCSTFFPSWCFWWYPTLRESFVSAGLGWHGIEIYMSSEKKGRIPISAPT